MALPLYAVVVLGVVGVVVLLLHLSRWVLFAKATRVTTEEAAWLLHHYWSPKCTRQLPAKLRGVFWMDGNIAPETLITFMNSQFDATGRIMTLPVHDYYNWSYNTDCCGWIEYLITCFIGFNSTARFTWDENYENGRGYLYFLNLVWTPFQFGMRELDPQGHAWDRVNAYTMRKIIDEHGKKLPAFDDMGRKILQMAKPVKTATQIVQGDRVCGRPTAPPEVAGTPRQGLLSAT